VDIAYLLTALNLFLAYTYRLMTYCWTVQVETIGDAYMVSSGIPISNPRHAPELADMALTLCHGVTKFQVKNIPFCQILSDWQVCY